MPRYYFDTRDNDIFLEDDVGVDLQSVAAAKKEAAASLAEFARDVLPGSVARILSIEVRDEFGPVLKATLRFEVQHMREGL